MTDHTDRPEPPFDFDRMMPAIDAVMSLEPLLGGAVAAKLELGDRLRDGRLVGYSRHAWVTSQRDVLQAWRVLPDDDDPRDDVRYDIRIEEDVWRRSIHWSADQATWRWPSGRFSVVHKVKTKYLRHMMDDIGFDPTAIAAVKDFLTGTSNNPAQPSTINKNDDTGFLRDGNNNKANHNTRGRANGIVVLELLRLFQTGELQSDRFKQGVNLARHLETKLRSLNDPEVYPLKEGTLVAIARVVLPALKDGTPIPYLDQYEFKRLTPSVIEPRILG